MSVPAPAQIVDRLPPAAERIERGFLAAGQRLETSVAILDRLNASFAAQAAELTDDRLLSAGDRLAAAGQQVIRLADAHGADAAALAELDGIVTAITRRVAALQPITHEIDTLALNARVVAAGMGAAGSDFLAFTESIRAAVQRARANLDGVAADLQRVDRDLGTARRDAEAFTQRQGETIRAIPQRLDANRHTLTERRSLAGAAAEAARERADAIGRKVAEQIAALQLGDITRQRLEHVQAGVTLLADLDAAGGLAARILAAQLRDATEVLVEEGGQIERRLTQLAADAIAIDQLGLDMNAEATDRQDSFVTPLTADLRQTAALFAALRAADSDTGQRIRSVLDATGDLAGRLAGVQSVEQDIHIIGLNATLKCGRLGAVGRPLAAVAQELRSCGHRFAGEAAGVLEQLERLRSQAAGLLDPQRQQQHAALEQAAVGMLSAVEQLHRLEDGLQLGLDQLRSDAEQVGRLLAVALEQFAVHEEVAHDMRACVQFLADWSDAPAERVADEEAVLARIAATYTMAREREVHARLAPLSQAAPADSLDPNDVLF